MTSTQIFADNGLPEIVCVRLSVRLVQIVLDLRIRRFLQEQLHHRKMPVLRRHMKRRHALPVSKAAKRGFLIHRRPVVDQPLDRIYSVANRGPDEGRASIWIGVEGGARSHEPVEHLRTATLAGPDKSLVQNFLWIG